MLSGWLQQQHELKNAVSRQPSAKGAHGRLGWTCPPSVRTSQEAPSGRFLLSNAKFLIPLWTLHPGLDWGQRGHRGASPAPAHHRATGWLGGRTSGSPGKDLTRIHLALPTTLHRAWEGRGSMWNCQTEWLECISKCPQATCAGA